MMLSDAPKYVTQQNEEKDAEEEANEIAGFFQTKLN